MGGAAIVSGPDFSDGVGLDDVPLHGTLAGRVGDEPVLLSRIDGRLYAVGGACTHYGAALASGLIAGGTVRCPLHHACFSLRTGAVLRAPALEPLDRWRVDVEGARLFVREKESAVAAEAVSVPTDVRSIVIAGGGAAAFACAHSLRRLRYRGGLTMVSQDRAPPCDRPNLSKDYLVGTAPEEWLPLRSQAFYDDEGIDLRLDTEIVAINVEGQAAMSRSGEAFAFDRLLIATGSEPVTLPTPGFDLPNVHTLRSLADARAIIGRARPGARAAIIGSSFIGLEAAAALRQRGVAVAVISMDAVPFERILGADIGRVFQRLHEARGVELYLERTAASFDGTVLALDDGQQIDADFVLLGVGVRPRTGLAVGAGLATGNGIDVDSRLQTSVAGIYAAGDVARYPDPRSGGRMRIEHWTTALEQGRTVAANMLGLDQAYTRLPFFWSEQYGTAIRYVGHAARWDDVRIDGDVAGGAFTARYFEAGVFRASASIGRDRDNLEDELLLESEPIVG